MVSLVCANGNSGIEHVNHAFRHKVVFLKYDPHTHTKTSLTYLMVSVILGTSLRAMLQL